MSATRPDRRELEAAGYEQVHVELARWDGPREGIGDIGGVPHYFSSTFGEAGEAGDFLVRPVTAAVFALERELYAITTAWERRLQAGEADRDSNPRNGGVDARHDELTELLAPHREVPEGARRPAARMRSVQEQSFQAERTNYLMLWRPAGRDLPPRSGAGAP
ncbi:hypothetical protein OG900_01760 [Streptomyces sp. NBC_00433]